MPENFDHPQPKTVQITEALAKNYSYRPIIASNILGNDDTGYLSNRYLRGEQVWEQPPTITNTIKIGRLLGKGGYGEVYEVWKAIEPYRKFALKIPGQPLEITKSYILNEIQKLKLLSKPGNHHIPKIRDGYFYIRNEKIPYYITHILTPVERRFPTFAKHIPMDPVEALEQFYFLACGLKYITSNHIVHNDIKPENIMYYGNLPIITDYGTARSYSEINEVEFERLQGRLHGTPTWLPPELITISPCPENPDTYFVYYNLTNVGQKTDVWGLVLVWTRYLVGESLFHDVPIKNYQIPDIFLTTCQQFQEGKIIARYRQYAHRRCYVAKEKSLADLERIKNFLLGETQEAQRLQEHYKTLQISKLDRESVSTNSGTGRMLTARICLKKLQFLSRPRSETETWEFFLSAIFDIFDLCVAPVETRIKSYQLVEILEVIFPGLVPVCQKKLENINFPELISPDVPKS